MIGKVKSYDAAQGYGFIQPENGGADVFVHVTAVDPAHQPIGVGDAVEFTTTPGNRPGKLRALNVRRV